MRGEIDTPATTHEPFLHVLPHDLGVLHPLRVAFQHFRHHWYCDKLNNEQRRFEELEYDDYDLQALYLMLTEHKRPVAGCRLIASFTPLYPLPMEKKGEYSGVFKRPCVEVSRMIVGCKANPEDISTLYEAIYEFLSFPAIWSAPLETACAVVEPKYLARLQQRYSPEAFVAVGATTQTVTGTGKKMRHVPIVINLEAWGACFEHVEYGVRHRALAA